MTLKRRVIYGFAAGGIAVAALSLVLMVLIARGHSGLDQFHAEALFAAQEMGIHAEEAIERSFAYVVSGRDIEKSRYRVHMHDFHRMLADWNEVDGRYEPSEKSELKLISSIEGSSSKFETGAEAMFAEFELTGKVSQETYDSYNNSIFQLSTAIEDLVEVDRSENQEAQGAAVSLIWKAAGGMAGIAFLSVALALILGRRISGTVTRPIERLTQAAHDIAAGDLENKISIDSADEVGVLGKSLEQMRLNLKENFEHLNHEIQQNQKAEAQIIHLSHHDVLTGLPNRHLFQDRLVHDIAHARRKADRLALLMVDLDNFKNVNDTLGHGVGDEILIEVTTRFQSCLREGDTLARLGGDEFAVIQTYVETADDAANLAQRMVESLEAPMDAGGRQFHLTCSIGVLIVEGTDDDVDQLIARADMAMYQAKSRGRNGYQFFDEVLNGEVHERLAVEHDLRAAISEGQLVLHYQPVFDLKDGKVGRLEALVRWNHPTRGMVPPLLFIPIAEASDLIISIGEWVLREACAQSRLFKEAGLPAKVCVNVSTIQLMRSDFSQMVAKVLAETGADPNFIEIELTESVMVNDTPRALAIFDELRSLGISLTIDDFGTGYSSLQYLRSLPVDALKIDRSFVRDIESSKDAIAVAGAIISLGQNLGISVIAEGVETAAQLDLLRARGCSVIQGFYFSPPRPVAELEEIIAHIGKAWASSIESLPPEMSNPQ